MSEIIYNNNEPNKSVQIMWYIFNTPKEAQLTSSTSETSTQKRTTISAKKWEKPNNKNQSSGGTILQ